MFAASASRTACSSTGAFFFLGFLGTATTKNIFITGKGTLIAAACQHVVFVVVVVVCGGRLRDEAAIRRILADQVVNSDRVWLVLCRCIQYTERDRDRCVRFSRNKNCEPSNRSYKLTRPYRCGEALLCNMSVIAAPVCSQFYLLHSIFSLGDNDIVQQER